MGIDDALKACSFVKPGCAIPMHYNTFDVIKSDPTDFKKKVEEKGLNCQVLDFGQEINL
jgi:L-ascorbate metabolism protein UlaG (beta-lactamase superfamily)